MLRLILSVYLSGELGHEMTRLKPNLQIIVRLHLVTAVLVDSVRVQLVLVH